MKILFIKIFVLFAIFGSAQFIPIKPQKLSESDYNEKLIYLRSGLKACESNKTEDSHYYNNFVLYYDLDAPIDTCLKHFKRAIKNAPISTCNSCFQRDGSFKEYFFSTDRDKEILNVMIPVCDSVWNTLDSNLMNKLNCLLNDDQKYRRNLVGSKWVATTKKLPKEQEALDVKNTGIISKIIDSLGYPGRNMVGLELEDVAFLIIQHSDLNTQEKYLNLIKVASESNQLFLYAYPMLYDRICMKKNLPQLYGTQTLFDHKTDKQSLYKIDNINLVNKRRKQYGLSSIEYKIFHSDLDINK